MKTSTDYWMRFVHEQENNKPEKGYLIYLARNFQNQVRMMDITQENETETDTTPMIAKKKKENYKIYISRYTPTNGRMTKEQEDLKKSLTGQGSTRKALWKV